MLPKIDIPIHKCKLPSTGAEILLRPFTVKEEKLLLMNIENEDENDLSFTIKQIVNNCILNEGFDIDNIAYYDFEYLFLQLRKISVGETIELSFRHTEDDCNHLNKVTLNLNDIEIRQETSNKQFMITDDIGIKLKYPSIESMMKYNQSDVKSVFSLLLSCIDCVFDNETVYTEFTDDELSKFVEDIPQSKIKPIVDFISDFPVMQKTIEFKCEKCGKELSTEVRGLQNFFM